MCIIQINFTFVWNKYYNIIMLSIAERHKHILDKLNAQGFVKVLDIARELDVTPVTIRKDLKLLEEKILSEGKALNKDILKVDSFINHQVDPVLMAQIGEAFAAHFKGRGITKVVTIESSGIAPALMTASALGVPMVILKKQPSQILNDNLYQTVITSFTKETNYELTLSKKYISEEDHVLIIDDFLANGEAATGAIRLLRLAHATIAGLGVLVEKSFQPGRKKLIDQGTEVYALARVGAMDTDHVEFLPADDE